MEGNIFKADNNIITCDYEKYVLGIKNPDQAISLGRSYCYASLYESDSIDKAIVESMKYNQQDIYGVVIGRLQLMEYADVVIIASYVETIMRVM